MLPGKKYAPEDLLGILRKRFWLLLVPFAVFSAATAIIARQLPDFYRSETLILVVPQRVPENYVRATVTTRIEDRLQSIAQQILSRTRLERVIQDFNLYVDERRTDIMEDIVEKMRADINVQVVKGDAFRVSYVGKEPRTVMRVTDRLASLFIEESLRDREVLAEGTNQFLEAQLEDARRRLIEQEKKVEVYRRQFSGELPSQLEANLQVLQNTQVQIQTLSESLNRDRDEQSGVERQLAELERLVESAAETPAPQITSEGVEAGTVTAPAVQQLTVARAALANLELRLKPEHPDVQRMKRVIRDLEKKAEAEALTTPVAGPERRMSPSEVALQSRLQELRDRRDQLGRQISTKQAQEKQLRSVSTSYQQRVEKVPTRESEMAELTRDYKTQQDMYTSLLQKKEESQIAANLERRQIGEQFKLLDPARLPEKPFSPNRQQINAFGLVGGLAVGLGLIVLVEYRDSSFKTDDEVISVLGLPVLAVVPLMQSEGERRKRSRRRLLRHVSLASAVAACMAVVVYTFIR